MEDIYKYNRNSTLLILNSFLSSLKMVVLNFIFILGITEFMENESLAQIVWIVFLIFCLQRLFSIFDSWYRLKYKITAEGINIIEGIFTKNDFLINFKNIQKIELSETIFQRFLKQTTLTIKTDIIGDNSEIKLEMLSHKIASLIKEKFDTRKKTNYSNTEKSIDLYDSLIYRMDMKDLLTYSILTMKFLLIIPFSIALYFEVNNHVELRHYFDSIIGDIDFSFSTFMISILCVVIILSVFYGFIWVYLRYRNFLVYQTDSSIFFSQGLSESKERSLLKEDVNALLIKRNLMMIMFGKLNVHAVISGYTASLGRSNKQSPDVIFPCAKKRNINKYINVFFPNTTVGKIRNIKKLSWLDRIELTFMTLLILVLNVWIISFFITSVALPIMLFTLFIIGCIWNNRYNAFKIHSKGDFITVYKGFLSNEVYIIKKASIEQTIIHQNFIQSRFNTGSLDIYFRENPIKKIKIHHIPLNETKGFSQWCWKDYN